MKANEKDTFRHNGYYAFANGVGDMGHFLGQKALNVRALRNSDAIDNWRGNSIEQSTKRGQVWHGLWHHNAVDLVVGFWLYRCTETSDEQACKDEKNQRKSHAALYGYT